MGSAAARGPESGAARDSRRGSERQRRAHEKTKAAWVGNVAGRFRGAGHGCAAQIEYTPIAGPAVAPTTNVALLALQVVDNRPPDKLKNKNEVGQVRNGIGIPSGIDDKDPDVVPRTVSEATTDALKLAGVGVQGGQKRLLATVTEFWMDGYMGYKAGVTVQYALQGPSGAPLWTQEIKGAAGGHQLAQRRVPTRWRTSLFEKALNDLASKANAQFKSPGFLQAMAM